MKIKQLCLSSEFHIGRLFDFILFTGQNEKNQTYTLTDGVILFPLTEPPPFFLTGSAEPAISWLGFCNSIFLQA